MQAIQGAQAPTGCRCQNQRRRVYDVEMVAAEEMVKTCRDGLASSWNDGHQSVSCQMVHGKAFILDVFVLMIGTRYTAYPVALPKHSGSRSRKLKSFMTHDQFQSGFSALPLRIRRPRISYLTLSD